MSLVVDFIHAVHFLGQSIVLLEPGQSFIKLRTTGKQTGGNLHFTGISTLLLNDKSLRQFLITAKLWHGSLGNNAILLILITRWDYMTNMTYFNTAVIIKVGLFIEILLNSYQICIFYYLYPGSPKSIFYATSNYSSNTVLINLKATILINLDSTSWSVALASAGTDSLGPSFSFFWNKLGGTWRKRRDWASETINNVKFCPINK